MLCSIILSVNTAFAAENCFIAKENGKVLQTEGDCKTRYSPGASFKIALALMGYDAGILKDEIHPQWLFKPEYEEFLESWKEPQNPTSWMKNSCVLLGPTDATQLSVLTFPPGLTFSLACPA